MKEPEKSENKQKLTRHQMELEAMKFPDYYRTLVIGMLSMGESLEAVQEEIDKYSHMY